MVDKRDLDKKSDFVKRYTYITPYLKFNGKEGHFHLLDRDEKNDIGKVKALGEKIEVVFLKRGKFKLYSGNLFSNEAHPNQKEPIRIYEVDKENNRRRTIDVGPYQEMKKKHGLKTKQLPFVLVEGKIAKFGITPSSLANFWEYLDLFKKGDSPYEFTTTITCKQVKGKQGRAYYVMHFARKEKVADLDKVADAIDEVVQNVEMEEDSFKSMKESEKEFNDGGSEEFGPAKEIKDKDIPVIEKDEEINVDDIPFGE